MDQELRLKVTHDIAEGLQRKLEGKIQTLDRCIFVLIFHRSG